MQLQHDLTIVIFKQKDINNVEDDIVTFTGVYPGYTKTQLTLYNQIDKHGYSHFDFWTTSESNGYASRFMIMTQNDVIAGFGISSVDDKDSKKYLVRPVLAK